MEEKQVVETHLIVSNDETNKVVHERFIRVPWNIDAAGFLDGALIILVKVAPAMFCIRLEVHFSMLVAEMASKILISSVQLVKVVWYKPWDLVLIVAMHFPVIFFY